MEQGVGVDSSLGKWFLGGKINACYNCVDRHISSWRRNKAAIVWEGEGGEDRVLTYYDLYREVNKFAKVLKSLGVKKGDCITIYLPMIPEMVISVLACARIAVFVTLKSGFEPSDKMVQELRDHVAQRIGPIARPGDIFFTYELPKTRSGKIMRRLLRDIAEGKAFGDTTILADPSVMAMLKRRYEEKYEA